MRAVELIERKRDGAEHAPGEVAWLIEGYVAGRVAPEQMSAWAMAVVFSGLSDAETHELTQTMVDSGATIDLSSLGRTVVDKHSTGGVGDKTTIALAPLAAAMGMPVAKLSGRGLAHTGGTLDKLEAIPGLRVGLSVEELVAQVARIGCALAAQTDDLVPADRLLYALRDVTGHRPGARPDRRLRDVEEARRRRRRDPPRRQGGGGRVHARPRLGARARGAHARHRRARGAPDGVRADGDGLAARRRRGQRARGRRGVRDARRARPGRLPRARARLGRAHGGALRPRRRLFEGRRLAENAVSSGEALRALERLVEAQGGDPRLAERPWEVLETAPVVVAVAAPRAGSVMRCGALPIGRAAMRLGAGRERKEDPIDHAVGIVVHCQAG